MSTIRIRALHEFQQNLQRSIGNHKSTEEAVTLCLKAIMAHHTGPEGMTTTIPSNTFGLFFRNVCNSLNNYVFPVVVGILSALDVPDQLKDDIKAALFFLDDSRAFEDGSLAQQQAQALMNGMMSGNFALGGGKGFKSFRPTSNGFFSSLGLSYGSSSGSSSGFSGGHQMTNSKSRPRQSFFSDDGESQISSGTNAELAMMLMGRVRDSEAVVQKLYAKVESQGASVERHEGEIKANRASVEAIKEEGAKAAAIKAENQRVKAAKADAAEAAAAAKAAEAVLLKAANQKRKADALVVQQDAATKAQEQLQMHMLGVVGAAVRQAMEGFRPQRAPAKEEAHEEEEEEEEEEEIPEPPAKKASHKAKAPPAKKAKK